MSNTAPIPRASVAAVGDEITISPSALRSLSGELQRFMLEYRFAMQEIETKLAILREEFMHMHEYNPIEHVSSRVKTPESLLAKVERRGVTPEVGAIRREIQDIAGVRVTCAFIRDVYRLFGLLTQQDDITVLEVEDYIEHPKPNGYKSLHAILSVPVYLSSGRVDVPRRGAVPHDRDGLLGEPRAQDLLQVPAAGTRTNDGRAQAGSRFGGRARHPHAELACADARRTASHLADQPAGDPRGTRTHQARITPEPCPSP